MSSRGRRSRLALVLVAATAVLAACGIPGDGEPRIIDASNVPGQLLEPVEENTTTTQPSLLTVTTTVAIFLADSEGQLEEVERQVASPATPEKIIESLLAGPTEEEADRLSTAITSDTRLLDLDGPNDGLVVIDLSRDLLDITGRQQILALAQVVHSVASLNDVDRVLFEFDGEPAEVPNGSGTLTASPLTESSYRSLRE